MAAKPPQEIEEAFLAPMTRHTRRAEIFESDGVTPWMLSPKIKGGAVNVDYSRAERRSFDLEFDNGDEAMTADPGGGFWYDKIIKIFRGVKVVTPGRQGRVVIVSNNNNFGTTLYQSLLSSGYRSITIDTSITTVAELEGKYDIIADSGGYGAPSKAGLLIAAYDAGYSVISTGNDSSSGHIPWVTLSGSRFDSVSPFMAKPAVTVNEFQRKNLLTTPRFDVDTNADGVPDSWSAYNGGVHTTTRTLIPLDGGVFAGRVTAVGLGGTGSDASGFSQSNIPLKPDTTYTMAVDVLMRTLPAGKRVRLHINTYDSANANVGSFLLNGIVTSARHKLVFTTASTVVKCHYYFWVDGGTSGSAADTVVEFSRPSFEVGNTDGAYIDDRTGLGVSPVTHPVALGWDEELDPQDTGQLIRSVAPGSTIVSEHEWGLYDHNMMSYPAFETFSGSLATGWTVYNNSAATEPTTTSLVAGTGGTTGTGAILRGRKQRVTWTVANTTSKGLYTGDGFRGTILHDVDYVFEIYARAGLDKASKLDLRWNNGPSEIQYISNPNFSSTTWQRYIVRVKWYRGAVIDPRFFISITYGDGSIGWVEFSNAHLHPGTTTRPYFDGTYGSPAGCEWLGAADASQSKRVPVNSITGAVSVNQKGGRWFHSQIYTFPTTGTGRRGLLAAGYEWISEKYEQPTSTDWETQIGEFLIDRISGQGFPKSVKVTGRDYTKRMLTSKFAAATGFNAGASVDATINSIAANAGILTNKRNIPPTGKTLGKDYIFERGTTRWDACKQLAESIGRELYFDEQGVLTMREYLDPSQSPLTYTFRVGPEVGNLSSYERSANDSRLYNHIVVTGESSAVIPVHAEARNDNPASPTNIARIGDRLYQYTSSFITTTAQAQDVANKFLKIHSLEEFEINFGVLTLPWLEVGEIIEFDDPSGSTNQPDRFLLSSLTIPMGLGTMTALGKRVAIVG